MRSNLLINETSPYLLQHAHNPVNWLPWGEMALARAREEDKVILVSIGYSACHWCHVMERESFEDEATAEIMNRHFINIKIDREERPDIDHIYMDAVQAMTGAGGWPLNVFLTPDARPFYGGTYFPPVKAYGRSSWKEILYGIAEGWQKRRTEIEAQATQLTDYLQRSNDFGQQHNPMNTPATEGLFTKMQCQTMFDNIMKAADTQWGGFGKAPKFPQTFTIAYLMSYHHFTGEEKALEQALLSVDKMVQGGIYDQAGGGFCRYSTDTEWLAPHFEKMLYDNALVLSVLCDAFAITGKKVYEKIIRNTIAFAKRELMDEKGGFYSALDADSEGAEGRFYVWELQEVREALGPGADLFCRYFDITEKGNWEEKNILRVLQPLETFAAANGLEPGPLEAMLDKGLAELLEIRSRRIRPGTDDKLLLGWNALMISALCKAAAVLEEESYKADAVRCFDFLWDHFRKEGFECYHTFKNGQAKYPAFLDDYAALIRCCIDLQEISSGTSYLEKAQGFTEFVMNDFADTASPYFFFTGSKQQDVIVRKKEVHDGATASGNSLMAGNLRYLGIVFNRQEWTERSGKMLQELQPAIMKYPSSFGVWAGLILQEVAGYNEIAIIGEGYEAARSALGRHYLPNKILQCSPEGDRNFPLLEGKKTGAGLQFYLCKNYSCQSPETELSVLLDRIRQNDNF